MVADAALSPGSWHGPCIVSGVLRRIRTLRGAAMRRLICLGSVLLVVSTGCNRVEERSSGREIPPLAPLPPGKSAVRLNVLRGQGGGAVALADVHINDQGPLTFIVDTGASHSVIQKSVARQLGLPQLEGKIETIGVQSVGEARRVMLDRWRVGDIDLPGLIVSEIDMPAVSREYRLDGLLGSDVLSRFGAVLIDYDGQVLEFRPRGPDTGR